MEKFLNNQTDIVKKLKKSDKKKLSFTIELPDVYLDESGNWVSDRNVVISSYLEFCEYAKRHEEIISFLKNNYPEVISTIWKNAFSEFSSAKGSTIAGKLLSGQKISSKKIFASASSSDSKNAIHGILRRINHTKDGINGEKVTLPVMKKTKKEVMTMLENSPEGYYLPELSEDGLVVMPVDKTHFAGNFFAVNASEVAEEQVREYLYAPIAKSKDVNKNNLDLIVKLSKEIYKKIGKPEMTSWVRMMIDTCADVYPLSFLGIEDKNLRKKNKANEPVGARDDQVNGYDDEQNNEDMGISRIIVEGKSISETDVNEEGKLIMSITSKNGLSYTFVVSEDEKGKILHAKPIEKEF